MESPNKTKRKQFIIAVGSVSVFVGLMVLGMWLSDPERGKPTPMEIQAKKAQEVKRDFTFRSDGAVSAQESWIAISDKRLAEMQRQNKELVERLDRMERERTEKGNSVLGTPVSTGSALPNAQLELPLPPPPPPPAMPPQAPPASIAENVAQNLVPPMPPAAGQGAMPPQGQPGQGGKAAAKIRVISLSDDDKDSKDKKGKKNITHYLPAGGFVTSVLLSGMDAPTGGQAMSNPVPTVLRLMDMGQLPNFFNSELENCHATGAGYGDISSERAHIRLELLVCVTATGDVIEEPVSGYITGEDGKAGMRGRLVEKNGALIAKTLVAGIFSGVGSSISSQYQQVATSALGSVTSVDPNKAFENGLATGSANTLEKLSDYYLARVNEIYPIIEIDANRIVEIVFHGGTDLGQDIIGKMGRTNE